MGTAAEIAIDEIENRMIRAQEKRLELAEYFEKNKYGKLNFTDVHTSPFILSFTLLDEDAESFLIRMKDLFVASSGSACSSSIMAESHVKLALGLKNDVFRISIT